MGQLNMARVKLALRGRVIYGQDEVRNLLHGTPGKPGDGWMPTIPAETRLRMLKLKSDRRSES